MTCQDNVRKYIKYAFIIIQLLALYNHHDHLAKHGSKITGILQNVNKLFSESSISFVGSHVAQW